MRWRPTLGLLVILSLVIVVEGVVTVGRLVLDAAPTPPGQCSPSFELRANKWCQLQYSARTTGVLPTAEDFTNAVGAQTYAWKLTTGQSAKIIDSSDFMIFAACIGDGQLDLKVYAGDTARYDVVFGCVDTPRSGFHVAADPVFRGPYVIIAAPIGTVTAAEYFIR